MKDSDKEEEKKRLIGWNILIGIAILCISYLIAFLSILKLSVKSSIKSSINLFWPIMFIGIILIILQAIFLKIY